MHVITTLADLDKARLFPRLGALAARHLQRIHEGNPTYDPEDDGYLAIVTSTDTDQHLGQALGTRWRHSLFEGVSYDANAACYITVILRNNQFAITVLIPNEPWLDPAIRQRLMREMDDRHPPIPST